MKTDNSKPDNTIYFLKIEGLKKRLSWLKNDNFVHAHSGTNHEVFLSKKHVTRFHDSKMLIREAELLEKLNHPLIPKILWRGKTGKLFAMVENRLAGNPLNLTWKKSKKNLKIIIIKNLLDFLNYLRTQRQDYVYSIRTGKRYTNFWEYLMDGVGKKISIIKRSGLANKQCKKLTDIINNTANRKLFVKNESWSLVHGDLIIHNLLADNKGLSGVLDWEWSFFGDYDYDLCRIFYYLECAKDYLERGIDDSFEAEFMSKFTSAIKDAGLISQSKHFWEKYNVIRSVFLLNALFWSVNSSEPIKNVKEITRFINK
jgi:thiamine kinase-like enzyme